MCVCVREREIVCVCLCVVCVRVVPCDRAGCVLCDTYVCVRTLDACQLERVHIMHTKRLCLTISHVWDVGPVSLNRPIRKDESE